MPRPRPDRRTGGSQAQAAPLPGGLAPASRGTARTRSRASTTAPSRPGQRINIFAGNDFLVRRRSAEAEGRVLLLDDFDMAKDTGGSAVYNVGIVGASATPVWTGRPGRPWVRR
ncbi:hypothetical protein ACFQ3Z_09280 [Streptomyces nogalater]